MTGDDLIHLDHPTLGNDGSIHFAASGTMTEQDGSISLWDGTTGYEPGHPLFQTIQWLTEHRSHFKSAISEAEIARLHALLEQAKTCGKSIDAATMLKQDVGLIDLEWVPQATFSHLLSLLPPKPYGATNFLEDWIYKRPQSVTVHKGWFCQYRFEVRHMPKDKPSLVLFRKRRFCSEKTLSSWPLAVANFRTTAADAVVLMKSQN